MTTVLLSLGSNLRPRHHLLAAVNALQQRFGRIRVSPTYRTAAVGFDGPDFLNNAVALHTELDLLPLDAWLHALEDAHGRDRSGPRFSDRTLDIDVVFYGERIVEGPGHLRIPRPELRHAFVLKPLADIAADFVDPVSGRTLGALWQAHAQFGEAFEVVELREAGTRDWGLGTR
ncbi:2-amino-4-hydroxy-6-hydroxymethyldihydropteridine diphosphokinase [Xanthomonas sp. AmX2]|uniref:2-amino-4-hydroxy-6- hydroxymethyldihydropteridine diphosphokinase n=1 Tax=Xanthomonas sp. TaxID=29446 RepID=UPI001980415E|nr:2-amino-4-hydroxy-6-hydroxymethyldihydropteridine diphosphokinase [Xanthomonas sp.]MBN6151727.1 2-amino-4-hydroxy-6-hydroxymethyldihydropteridine diphosphokinase [Xanthomonas sp.]